MTPSEIRFAADGMLRSLATWLRLLGYDCIAAPLRPGFSAPGPERSRRRA